MADNLTALVRMFDEYEQATQEGRADSEKCRDY